MCKLVFKFQLKKKISPIIKQLFTAQSLAYWFMDDGGKLDYTSNKGKAIVLNTHNFTFDEVHFLNQMLIEKFQFKCWVKTNKNKPIIVISGSCYEQVIYLIEPFIIPSMVYKLPTKRIKKQSWWHSLNFKET